MANNNKFDYFLTDECTGPIAPPSGGDGTDVPFINVDGDACIGGNVQTDFICAKTQSVNPPPLITLGSDVAVTGGHVLYTDCIAESTLNAGITFKHPLVVDCITENTLNNGIVFNSEAIFCGGILVDTLTEKLNAGGITLNSNAIFTQNVQIDDTLVVDCITENTLNNGIAIKNDTTFQNNVSVNNALAVPCIGELVMAGGTKFTSAVTFQDDVTVTGSLLQVDTTLGVGCIQEAMFGQGILIKDDTTFQSDLTITGVLSIDCIQESTLNAGTKFTNATTFQSTVTFQSTLAVDCIEEATLNAGVKVSSTTNFIDDVSVQGIFATDCIEEATLNAGIKLTHTTTFVGDADVCGTLHVDTIASKTLNTPVNLEGVLFEADTVCVPDGGEIQVNTIVQKTVAGMTVNGIILINDSVLIPGTGELRTDNITTRTGGPICITAPAVLVDTLAEKSMGSGVTVTSPLHVDIITEVTPNAGVCISGTRNAVVLDEIDPKTGADITFNGDLCIAPTSTLLVNTIARKDNSAPIGVRIEDILITGDTVDALSPLLLGPTTATLVEVAKLNVLTDVKGSLTVQQDTALLGSLVVSQNLTVNGMSTTINTQDLNVVDSFIFTNKDYTNNVARNTGIVFNCYPQAENGTVAGTAFTNAVDSTVQLTTASTFAVHDFVLVSGANTPGNDGVYEVLAFAAGAPATLTIKGTPLHDYVQNTLVTDAVVGGGVVRKVKLCVLQTGINVGEEGKFQEACGTEADAVVVKDLVLGPTTSTTNALAIYADTTGHNLTESAVIVSGNDLCVTGELQTDTIVTKTATALTLVANAGASPVVLNTTEVQVDNVISRTTNTDLTLEGNGTGVVCISDVLRVDSITDKAGGTLMLAANAGASPLDINASEARVDRIVSRTLDTDLTLEGNGTGVVCITDALNVDVITAKTLNMDLILAGNGTGVVCVTSPALHVDAVVSKGMNADLALTANGTGEVCVNNVLRVDSVVSKGLNTDLTLEGNGTGVVCISDTVLVNTISSKTINTNLTLTANGTGEVCIPDVLRVDTVHAKTANTNLTLEGNGTGVVCVNDPLNVDSVVSKTLNANLVLEGNGTGVVCINDALNVDSVVSKTLNTDLTLAGNGTGEVCVNDVLRVDTINAKTGSTITLGPGADLCVTGSVLADTVVSKTLNANLVLEGNGTGVVCVNDVLNVDSIVSKTLNADLVLEGNGAGKVCVTDVLNVDTVASKTLNANLTLEGNGTGVVCLNDVVSVDVLVEKTLNNGIRAEGVRLKDNYVDPPSGYYYNGLPLWGAYTASSHHVQVGNLGGPDLSSDGYEMTLMGYQAGSSLGAGCSRGVMIGTRAGANATSGYNNIFMGWESGLGVITGNDNIAIGRGALGGGNTSNNIAIGTAALANISNWSNIGIGRSVFVNATNIFESTGMGHMCGITVITGTQNTLYGAQSDVAASTIQQAIAIGRLAVAQANYDVQLGERINTGSGVCYYRNQQVIRADWNTGGLTLASIDNSGNIIRDTSTSITRDTYTDFSGGPITINVNGGASELCVVATELQVDAVVSKTTNANLTLAGNGTGIVVSNDTIQVVGDVLCDNIASSLATMIVQVNGGLGNLNLQTNTVRVANILTTDFVDHTTSGGTRFINGLRFLSTGALSAYPTNLNYYESTSSVLTFSSDVWGNTSQNQNVTCHYQRIGNWVTLQCLSGSHSMGEGTSNNTIQTDGITFIPARFRPALDTHYSFVVVVDVGLDRTGQVLILTNGSMLIGSTNPASNRPTNFTFNSGVHAGWHTWSTSYRV